MKYYTLAARSVKENFRAAALKTAFVRLFARSAHDVSWDGKEARHMVAPLTRDFARTAPMNEPLPCAVTLDHGPRLAARATSWHFVRSPSSFSTKISISGIVERAPPGNIGKPEKNHTLRDARRNGCERNRLLIVGHLSRSMATTNDAERARAPQTMTDPTTSTSRRGAP